MSAATNTPTTSREIVEGCPSIGALRTFYNLEERTRYQMFRREQLLVNTVFPVLSFVCFVTALLVYKKLPAIGLSSLTTKNGILLKIGVFILAVGTVAPCWVVLSFRLVGGVRVVAGREVTCGGSLSSGRWISSLLKNVTGIFGSGRTTAISFEDIAILSFSIGMGLVFFSESVNSTSSTSTTSSSSQGSCEGKQSSDSHTLPAEPLVAYLIGLICAQVVFKGSQWLTLLVSWLFAALTLVVTIFVGGLYDSLPILAVIPLQYAIMLECDNQLLQTYLGKRTQEQLAHTSAEKEHEKLLAEERAREIRFLIANVAHDLKTPLQAIGMGSDEIKQVISAAMSEPASAAVSYANLGTRGGVLMNRNGRILKRKDGDEILEVSSHISSACAFMSMIINRAIDFTKVSHDIKLAPSMETLNLERTLKWPASIVRNLQNRISVVLEPTSSDICRFVITDKGWLTENLLCLFSNAVKYSQTGTATARCFLWDDRDATSATPPSPTPTPPAAPAPPLSSTSSTHPPAAAPAAAPARNNAVPVVVRSNSPMPLRRQSSSPKLPVPIIRNTGDLHSLGLVPIVEGGGEEDDRGGDVEDDADLVPLLLLGGSASATQSSARVRRRTPVTTPREEEPLPISPQWLCVEVEDTGVGIADNLKEELFNPLRQAHRKTGGTGLGLFSMRKRVEALGGACGVRNRRDSTQGCCFWFTVPYRPDDSASAAAAAAAASRSSTTDSSLVSRSNSSLNLSQTPYTLTPRMTPYITPHMTPPHMTTPSSTRPSSPTSSSSSLLSSRGGGGGGGTFDGAAEAAAEAAAALLAGAGGGTGTGGGGGSAASKIMKSASSRRTASQGIMSRRNSSIIIDRDLDSMERFPFNYDSNTEGGGGGGGGGEVDMESLAEAILFFAAQDEQQQEAPPTAESVVTGVSVSLSPASCSSTTSSSREEENNLTAAAGGEGAAAISTAPMNVISSAVVSSLAAARSKDETTTAATATATGGVVPSTTITSAASSVKKVAMVLPTTTTTTATTLPSSYDGDQSHGPPVLPTKILIVDDSLSILKMTSKSLERFGYSVFTADNGAAAVDLFKKYGNEIDVILMDLQMPVMDGLEATRRVRSREKRGLRPSLVLESMLSPARRPSAAMITSLGLDDEGGGACWDAVQRTAAAAARRHVVIIGMSANSDDETRSEALKAGMDHFIAKPFDLRRFKEALSLVTAGVPDAT